MINLLVLWNTGSVHIHIPALRGFFLHNTCFTSGLIPYCLLKIFRLASRRPLLMNDRSDIRGLGMEVILSKMACLSKGFLSNSVKSNTFVASSPKRTSPIWLPSGLMLILFATSTTKFSMVLQSSLTLPEASTTNARSILQFESSAERNYTHCPLCT